MAGWSVAPAPTQDPNNDRRSVRTANIYFHIIKEFKEDRKQMGSDLRKRWAKMCA